MIQKRNLYPENFDIRMIENHLREGKITKDQVKSFMGSLTDESENCEKIVIDDDTLSGNAGYTAESSDDTSDY